MVVKPCPDRGDIIFTDFDPVVGREQGLDRPALVVSPKLFNEGMGLALVAPITSKKRGIGFEVVLDGTETKGVILCQQVKTIDFNARGYTLLEKAPTNVMAEVLAKVGLLVK